MEGEGRPPESSTVKPHAAMTNGDVDKREGEAATDNPASIGNES